jgi:hypothetical protein
MSQNVNYTILLPAALACLYANDDDELRQQAGLLIGAIDPYVGYVFGISG